MIGRQYVMILLFPSIFFQQLISILAWYQSFCGMVLQLGILEIIGSESQPIRIFNDGVVGSMQVDQSVVYVLASKLTSAYWYFAILAMIELYKILDWTNEEFGVGTSVNFDGWRMVQDNDCTVLEILYHEFFSIHFSRSLYQNFIFLSFEHLLFIQLLDLSFLSIIQLLLGFRSSSFYVEWKHSTLRLGNLRTVEVSAKFLRQFKQKVRIFVVLLHFEVTLLYLKLGGVHETVI